MTENIINLNKTRKTKIKQQKKATADANALKFGRGKTAKQQDTNSLNRRETILDGHKREDRE